jgi:hypothetical protein
MDNQQACVQVGHWLLPNPGGWLGAGIFHRLQPAFSGGPVDWWDEASW